MLHLEIDPVSDEPAYKQICGQLRRLIYDGLLLWIIYSFSDYPLEKVTLSLIAFNPVDLARIIMLLKLDISALMGYTGAFYKDFLGHWTGTLFSVGVLALWAVVPIVIALQIFRKKDL